MASSAQLYVLLCLVNFVHSVSHPKIASDSFCYEEDDPSDCGPSFWEGQCNTGSQQSPVDLNFNSIDSLFYPRKTVFSLGHEYFQQFNSFYAINNGHTMLVQLDPVEQRSNLILEGADLMGSYVFSQLHFHWGERNSVGSEHTVLGRRYPMEVHLVHFKSIYGTLSNAMEQNDREAIAVFAVFFEISNIPNVAINSVVEAAGASQLRNPGAIMNFNMPLRISSFFPWKMDFVRYLGSLTTPTCDETVIWTVFRHPIPISEFQMNAFRRLRNEESRPYNNFRPIQPINGRPMRYFRAKGINSFFPSIDRIWSVKGGFFTLLSQTKNALTDLILKTLITPSFVLSSLSNLVLRLFHFMVPIIVIYK